MRKSALIFAGLAVTLAGAAAVRANEHVMTVLLPDGSVEHVRYTGDVAPHIVVRPFGVDSPFAEIDRLSAEPDRQASAMIREASTMAADPTVFGIPPQLAVMADAPAGATYSYVSSTTVNGKTCTTSVRSIAQGEGKTPHLLRTVAGDCSTAMARPIGPTPAVAPAPPAAPKAPMVSPDSI